MDAEAMGLEYVGKRKVREERTVVYPGNRYGRRSEMETWLEENCQEDGWIVDNYLGSQDSVVSGANGETVLQEGMMTEQDRATSDEDKAKYEAMINEGLGKVFKQGVDFAYAPIQQTLDALGYGHREVCEVLRELEATRLKSAQMIGEMMLERDAAIAAARAEGHAAGLEDAARLASIATNAEGDAYERLCCLPDDIRALTTQV